MSVSMSVEAQPALERDTTGRQLFRYVTADEWRDYRSILSVFANTFFVELSPDDVVSRLLAAEVAVNIEAVPDRLESLRRWGNLTVSSSIGNPSSLADYYRRRSRYLITSAGQEVHDLVEGVLGRVEDVRDVSTGRLGSIRDALAALNDLASDQRRFSIATATELGELIRAVFDPHVVFTAEITQFFAAINQWQSRYDLTPDELRFFAEVLVGYVSDRLDEIERAARPIARLITELEPHLGEILQRGARGLALRVERAGLSETVAVRRSAGERRDDWVNLAAWFVRTQHAPSRLEQLRRDALAAIRTLTQNLARLSRSGIGASSRRADFLRLAMFFDQVEEADVNRLAAAALGLYPCRHLGTPAADHEDPVPASTPWKDAPRATVAIALRERGDTSNRGQASPIRDRRQERELIRRRRETEATLRRKADTELLEVGRFDHSSVRMLTMPALRQLQTLLGQSRFQAPEGTALVCTVHRTPGLLTFIDCPEGRLELVDIAVEVRLRG
jgi:uncharacterized protein (TIGR02677 family)